MAAKRSHAITTTTGLESILLTNLPAPDTLQAVSSVSAQDLSQQQRKQWVYIHPTPATKSMQRTEGGAVGVAAAIAVFTAIVLQAVGRSAEDDAWAPETLTAQAHGAAAAKETRFKAWSHIFQCSEISNEWR